MWFTYWAYILLLFYNVKSSKQETIQHNSQEIMEAILTLENRFEDKMTYLLEEKFKDINYMMKQMDASLTDVKADLASMKGNVHSMDASLTDVKDDLASMKGNVRSMDASLTNVKADLASMKGNVHSMDAEMEAFGERSSLSLIASQNGKLLQEQTLNELSDLKVNISLNQEQTLSELNDIKENISEEFQGFWNFSEQLNDTSALLQNITEDFIEVNNIQMTKVPSIKDLIQNIKQDTESLKIPVDKLNSIDNVVKGIQNYQVTSMKEFIQEIKLVAESLKSSVNRLNSINNVVNSIDNVVKGIQNSQVTSMKELMQEVKTHVNKLCSIDNVNKDIQITSVGSLKELMQGVKKDIESLKTFVNKLDMINNAVNSIDNTVNDLQNSQVTSIKELIQEILQQTSSLKTPIKKLDSINTAVKHIQKIVDKRECLESEEFVLSPSDKCYKTIRDQARTWPEADSLCKSKGMTLAEPADDDVAWLQKYVNEKYGNNDADYWIGGRGIGSNFKWQRSGQVLPTSNRFWSPGQPNHGTSSSICVYMWTSNWSTRHETGKPYRDYPCSEPNYFICERVLV